jgi:hypothetical protein
MTVVPVVGHRMTAVEPVVGRHMTVVVLAVERHRIVVVVPAASVVDHSLTVVASGGHHTRLKLVLHRRPLPQKGTKSKCAIT